MASAPQSEEAERAAKVYSIKRQQQGQVESRLLEREQAVAMLSYEEEEAKRTFKEHLTAFVANARSPIAQMSTNDQGFYKLQVEKPGSYVLMADASSTHGKDLRWYWFIPVRLTHKVKNLNLSTSDATAWFSVGN